MKQMKQNLDLINITSGNSRPNKILGRDGEFRRISDFSINRPFTPLKSYGESWRLIFLSHDDESRHQLMLGKMNYAEGLRRDVGSK